ncbi:methyltransferase domain-containing protein [Aquimarina sp. 2201CG1-2-11]|uniref:class I SAM-dependent methyltransferase n=1 Tax=Aquimarina discodermiae TaxID=3231043 RepID=UPI0034620DE5
MVSHLERNNGVFYINEPQENFSSAYIEVRKKEQRIYEDNIVSKLPNVTKTHRYYHEWKLRQQSTKRIISYLERKKQTLKILDLGCGNGWFSNQLSLIPNSEVFAVDLNQLELEQAVRIFDKQNLYFIYADIFSSQAKILEGFDIVTVNSCIQYFSDLEVIVDVLTQKLTARGELHIIDSPFYDRTKVIAAKNRTTTYYREIGVPEMIDHYFHHSLSTIKEKSFEIVYQPKFSIFNKLIRKRENPFYWIKILKSA